MVQIAAQAKLDFAKPFFAEVVFLSWWNIWLVKNDRIFRKIKPTFSKWKVGFMHEISLLAHRIKSRHKDELLHWIAFLPP